ncbi:dystonin isoform X13 [Salminus brasiliensis]|uniref:dystonin isoform X13 n=1 Tax=Salminus brasiliensis TaxID=930266 RepID=UPI003B833521
MQHDFFQLVKYFYKSVEEEKKVHTNKVNKLLNWMSSMKTNQSKDGQAFTDDKADTENSNKHQVPMEERETKKAEIAEALHSTQLMLTKHSDKMTEEEKCEMKEQLKSLHQAYSDLSQQTGDQVPSAEQEFQVIEGILDVRSGAILSVCRSVQNGLIDQSTGLSLLEAQLITSELILPEFRMCLDLEDAFKHNLVDQPMYDQLQALNEANKCLQKSSYAFEPLPVVAAVKDGVISERLAIKIVEIQLATGGLRLTYTGDCLSLQKAFQFGLIPHSLYIQILQRQNTWKDLIDPNTAEKVSLIQLMQRSVVHEETGLRLLPVRSGKDGSISLTSGREVSILRAMHEGLIDRETMLRLLSAQLFAGGIVDTTTNCKFTVEEALSKDLIDQDTASGILSLQAKNGGIVNPHNGSRLTVDEAVQCDLMSSRSALLVLEKQKCFMGLLWPHSGEILTVSTSLQHEIITDKLASELLCHRHKIAALYIPESSEVVDIDSAAQDGLIDTYTKELLKTLDIPDMFPSVDEFNDRFSTWLVMREIQLEGSQRSSDGMDIDKSCISVPSSSESEQLFISYLMMNSYMEPKSGQRLLILDGQLNKMAKVLLEMSDTEDMETNDSHASVHYSCLSENIPEDAHEFQLKHIDVVEVLPIEKSCVRITKENDAEFSKGGANGKEVCIKSLETDNTSPDNSSRKTLVAHLKTNQSATGETTLSDEFPNYVTNYALNTVAQQSMGMQISNSVSQDLSLDVYSAQDVNEFHSTDISHLEILHLDKPLEEISIADTDGNELMTKSDWLTSVSGEMLNTSSDKSLHKALVSHIATKQSAAEKTTFLESFFQDHGDDVSTLDQPSVGISILHSDSHDSPLDEDITPDVKELHSTHTSHLKIMHIEKPLTRTSEKISIEDADGNEDCMISLMGRSDRLTSVSGELLNMFSDNSSHKALVTHSHTINPESSIQDHRGDVSTLVQHSIGKSLSRSDSHDLSLDEDITQNAMEFHSTHTRDLEIMQINKLIVKNPEENSLEFSIKGPDENEDCMTSLTRGSFRPTPGPGEMFDTLSNCSSQKALVTKIHTYQSAPEETTDESPMYHTVDAVNTLAQLSIGISHSDFHDLSLDKDISQDLNALHNKPTSKLENQWINETLATVPEENGLEISVEGAERNENCMKTLTIRSIAPVSEKMLNASSETSSHKPLVTDIQTNQSAPKGDTLLNEFPKYNRNNALKTCQLSKEMQISHSGLRDSSLDKDIPQDVNTFHVKHTGDSEIIRIDKQLTGNPKEGDLEILIKAPGSGEMFTTSSNNSSQKALGTDIQTNHNAPEETSCLDEFSKYYTNNTVDSTPLSARIKNAQENLNESSLDEYVPQTVKEFHNTHTSDLEVLHIDESLANIPEESSLEIFMEGANGNGDCIKPLTNGSEVLASVSGEILSISLEGSVGNEDCLIAGSENLTSCSRQNTYSHNGYENLSSDLRENTSSHDGHENFTSGSSENTSSCGYATKMKTEDCAPEETRLSDTSSKQHRDDAVKTLTESLIQMQMSPSHFSHDSSLDKNNPDVVHEFHLAPSVDLEIMQTDKPLQTIPEQSGLKIFAEGSDGKEGHMKTLPTGPANLGEMLSTSLDSGSETNIKTGQSTLEETFSDASSQFHKNDGVHTLAPPSVGVQTSPTLCSKSATETKVEGSSTDCSALRGESDKNVKMTSEYPQCEGVWNDTFERAYAVHLLKAQVDEGSVLDVTPGKQFDLNAAVDKGLINTEIVSQVLALQPQQEDVIGNKVATMPVTEQALVQGSISSKVALQIMEQQNLMGDSASERTVSVSKAWETDVITEDIGSIVLDSKSVLGPEEKSICSISDPCLGMLEAEEAENVLQQDPDKKVAIHVLDFTGQQFSEELPRTENAVEPTHLPVNTAQMSSSLDSSHPLTILSDSLSKVIPGIENLDDHNSDSQDLKNLGQDGLNTDFEQDRNATLLGNVAQKETEKNEMYFAFGAFHDVSLARVGHVAHSKEAVSQMASPVQSDSGVSCSSQSNVCSDERKLDTFPNVGQWHGSESLKTASAFISDESFVQSEIEDVNTRMHNQSFSSSWVTPPLTPEHGATGSQADLQEWNVLSHHVEYFENSQTKINQKGIDQCTVTETSIGEERPEHEYKSEAGNILKSFKESLLSHGGPTSGNSTRDDFDTKNQNVNDITLQCMDLSQACSPDLTKTIPLLKVVPAVTLGNVKSGDGISNPSYSQAKDNAETAIVASWLTKSVSNRNVELASSPAPTCHVGEQPSVPAGLLPVTLLPNPSDKTLLNFARTPDPDSVQQPHSRDYLCTTLDTKDLREIPPALHPNSDINTFSEKPKTEKEGANVNEIQRTGQAINSSVNLIQHISQSSNESNIPQGLVDCRDPDLLQDEKKHERMNTENCLPKECGHSHDQRPPSHTVLTQSQFLEAIQGISSCKDPAMLKEILGNLSCLLESTSQEEEGSHMESTETEATLNTTEDCKDVFHQQPSETSASAMVEVEEAKVRPRMYSTQHYLECIGKLQDHYDALEDIRNDLLPEGPLTTDIEALHCQLENTQSLGAQLAAFPANLTSDLWMAEQLLNSADELTPTQIHQDLATVFVDLQNIFTEVCQLSDERSNAILQALGKAKINLESTYQDLLCSLDKLSSCIQDNYEMISKLDIMNTDDLELVKYRIQQNKDMEKNLSGIQQHMEDTAFDVQHFVSENAQFLNPSQNRQLLKSLSATQRAFKELMDRVFTQRHTLDLHLEIREDESRQQTAMEKQKEFVAKLQELCDDLTQTENRLIGHQQQAGSAKSVGDLQQYQQEHQALQKDIQGNASALNEVISSTKKFLEENRGKLTPEQIAAIEFKLEEAKSKANMLNQIAEESRKDLEKVVTTAIKQETEKVAAVEQLEESKNKIEGLLHWISNIGTEKEMGGTQKDPLAKQNGNIETPAKRVMGQEDDPNGNELNSTDIIPKWPGESEDSKELDLEQQFEKVKARHQNILSQQQELIIATQSAQALLDKQVEVLSPAEKEKLQRDIQELRGRYETSLTQAEQQMKQVQSVQEELRKFQGDCDEFEGWLQQAQEQMEELGAPAGQLEVLQENLQRQKSFYEDVISHKGDLRFITISGQKVLDVAKTCSRSESGEKEVLLEVDTSGTCAAVKEKLDSATARYKALHTQCNQLGTNLKDVVDKYKKYDDATGGLLTWLNHSEEEARRQQSEPIAADPQTLQRQLEETKALQGQTTGRQAAMETLRKTADALIASEGDLLSNQDEIQEAVEDIVERYDNLSKSVSDRNEKLQMTLTRSLSVQDGLDEMMTWMDKVEESLEKDAQVPLDSAAIADALSKEAALEQDISSRQSSISAMKAKVKKFADTAEPTAAVLLQNKMEGLSQRFADACEKHKQKVSQMEQLKEKVEQFEKTSEKVKQFVLKRSQALSETDGPGKNVNELAKLVQDTNEELAEHGKDMETLQTLSKELSNSGLEESKALIQGKMTNLSNTFTAFKDTIKEKEEEVLSCQDQLGEFKAATGVLMKWLEETKDQVPVVQPNCSEQGLGKDLQKVNGLLEEWTAKAPAVEDINSKGSALCSLISVLTSPAKAKMHHKSVTNGSGPGGHAYLTNKELMLVQQNMVCISEEYRNLGDLLKARSSDLSSVLLKVRGAHNEAESMLQWLDDMKKTAASWSSEPTAKDSVKTQMEQQKAYEERMKQKQQQYQQLREKVLHLIEENPDSPETAKWKHMLDQIDAGWKEVMGSMENRKQHLEESSRTLQLFQTTQMQLSQWLQEKELMMSVLGPLSVDPNMLNTQKQQVQILQKEFEGRRPQYEQLNEAAVAITSTSGKQDPAVEKLMEPLSVITKKWQDLTGQLSERDALIEQAVGMTTQFQELLRSLGESSAVLESQLNDQQALSTQPDAVKKQLKDTNAILTQLCEEKKKLKEAEGLCSELLNLVTEEYLRANLTKQLESVSKPFKLLEEKAGKRIHQLNSAFASSQQFYQTSKDFQDWLDQKLQEQAEPQFISAIVETLRQNVKEHSAVQRALSEHEEPYSTIMREGETLLQSTEGAEKVALQGQLSALRSNWEEVKRGASEHAEKLNTAMERANKYKENAENLSSWLQECEARSNKVKFSVNPVEVESSLSQVKAFQKDVDKRRGQMELLIAAADSLLEVATKDVDAVQDEKMIIGKNMDKLAGDLQHKKESLEKLSQKLKEFSDTQKELKGQLEGAQKQLESNSSLGVQAYSNKNLTNMKAQQTSLEGVHTQIENLKSIAQDLVVDVPDAEGVTDLLLQAHSLETEHSSISKAVEETCSTLENKLQGIGQFQNTIREMFTNFADLDDELDSMAPVGRDLETLRDQKGAMQHFMSQLQDLMNNTANAKDNCKKMLESEASPDLLGLKRDLEALSKQSGKLMDRANGRKEQVEDTLKHLDEFYTNLQTFTQKMAGAEAQEESQGPVGMETDVINQQLETFKVFQKEAIESLQTQMQELNWLGQGLIQNAPKGTSTKDLEHDIEEVNTRWNTLNKKVAERSAQLHEALLHCGRFQDALESLLSWLTDTEELVASQKPPSAEFKVVKAQIQEQRLLQRLLDDRRSTVELIKKEGGKVTELADSVDKEKIGREIECLGQRWDSLLKKAENRRKQLESILVVAQQFHETLEPLVEWLTATEKCLASSEPIGTQTSKLEEQIAQHKALEEEIIGHSKSLYQAMSLGQALRTVSCVDDKELIQAKLDSTQSGYIELQDRCRRKAELLQQALANAQLFGEDEVALMNWLDEVHSKLNDTSVQDYTPAVLDKQHADHLALHEDIELRKENVDQAMQNGLELLKQTTGDEVIVIQGKLDGIKTRYAEISTMSNDVLMTLNKALSLATKLQQTHKELSSWLEKVESELVVFGAQEPVGEQLTQVQDRQKALMKEVQGHRPVVDTLNEVSSALLELVPWRAREGLDKLVTDDNERYRSAGDAIAQHVDQTGAAILKSQQFKEATDTELAWLTEAERKLSSLGDIKLEPEQTTAQLQAQKGFSMDIMRHKDAVDDIVKTGEAIMSSKDEAEKQALKAKVQSLLEKYSVVSQLNSERCLQLERAHSLACQFWETYEELWPWLQETQANFIQLPQPAIEYEALRQQQEELRQLRELIAEHKPHIDKMNKTGPQLVELSPVEGEPIRETYQATDKLYAQLKADVQHRAAALDEAISKSTQFHDKIDPMLESLERIAERLRQPPSISVELEKIREQIAENKAVNMDLEKLQPSYETLKQRGEEMITRSEGADKDLSAKAVQDKLDQMVFVWNDIQALLEEREAKLLDVMDLAEKFWCDHCALIVTIKDTQDLLKELEEPGVDPSVVKQQQESVESYREEIDGLQEELNVVQNLGTELMTACGEPDKPVIKKSLDEVNVAWETLNKTWKERVERLEEAMQAAVQFQDGLQGMFDWVDILESKLDSMSPVGTDLETVKQQIEELKEFKSEAYQLQIEMERLNHQAGLLLKKVLEEGDRLAIQEPIDELKMLWNNLDEKVINRQHKLEGALLALGQFQHALDELLAWLTHTEDLLSEQKKTSGDPKAIEIELAKHHVLQNDVLAHKSTVEAVNKAGSDLMKSSAGEEACGLQSKLENLHLRWRGILEKTEQRRQLLDSALLQAQGFHGEIEDMQQWLKDTERQLLASKAVGGLPDTAREQLNAHLELCRAMEVKEGLYQKLLQRGKQLIALTPEGQDNTTEQDLHNLQDKWECVQAKVAERKVKLEEALAVATDFHNSLQDFINWLTQAEQNLTMVSPASLILETILFQIDEHKVFVTEVNSHRDQIIELDKTGTHLKYFSQKQDVVLIKNLLLSVQSRWEKVVQRSVERGRLLDDARKRAKQFHDSWTKLMEWLEESERALDSELEIANDPDKIKLQLTQHKEFQKALGGKHSVYDTTSRTGRALKDKTSLQDDNQKLDDMLCELRDKWDTVCGKSVERQNKLEEALLFSGQFTDALQALIDWLYKVEPQLAEDQPVHGDIDLVLNLIDSHKVFQKELGKRTGSVQALKRSARDLVENSHDDSSWVKVQMQELSTRWETVCALSVSKQTRLEQALCQAEEFHSTVHILLEWLAEAEQSLRFHGSLPDDEEALQSLIEQHKEFMKKLEEKRVALGKAISMGEAILAICHPDSITTVKHWNTIIKARFEEVTAWARQHQQRLSTALSELLATQELLESLLNWLQWAETTLTEKDKEALPQEIEEVKLLITEHQTFMEEMTRKQPDVDKVTKTHKRKATTEPQVQSQIPVLDKGRTGRKRSPTQNMYPATAQAQIETKNPRVNLLVSKWQQVWLLALDRRRKLNDALDRLEELKEFANFDFDVWRKRYMRWMNHKKSRVMDFFRRIDKDQDGKVTRQEFIEGILSSKFPTSRLEMSAVADIFDRDGDGYIDYYEFVAALHPNKDAYKPLTDADKIEDEVTRQVAKCKCPKRFQVEQIGANKYRFYLGNQFGDSQQLRLVRILRSTVMVRVGGGWMALDEFLVKNDPCRVHHHGSKMLRSESNSSITQSPIAKGRTNVELREKFILPEGTTQVMASFRYRGRRSRPSSRGASPNRSNSSHSCPVQPNPAATGTSKTPQHLTRNYDKPWLTNSKSATPLKSSDSFESQGSSNEGTPIQGSKLRLPGYLSGKSFQSGEEGTLINAAVLKARGQAIGSSKLPSRPGSKAGSRGSSRRGSDASDFDISDIQSVCSDMSETVTDSGRPTPRSASRQHGGKPSKIPTPQRRSTPTSKLAKTTKR